MLPPRPAAFYAFIGIAAPAFFVPVRSLLGEI
jgi:hypothetical protein